MPELELEISLSLLGPVPYAGIQTETGTQCHISMLLDFCLLVLKEYNHMHVKWPFLVGLLRNVA